MIVEKLKKSFLQQAFEGKLSITKSSDTSVLESLIKIETQKKQLINYYKVRSEPVYLDVAEEEKLFTIPDGWKWYRIGQLGVFKKGPFGSALTKGMFVKKSSDTVKVYEQKNAIQKDISLGEYYITRDYFEKKMKSFEVKQGDILVSCAGTIGETYVVPAEFEQGIINQALMKMTMVDELNKDYFLYYFDFILKKISNNLSSGSAIKNIPPFEIFKQLVIPLPPIEEQKRIVDKIEEIFEKLLETKDIEEKLITLKKSFPNSMKKAILYASICGSLTEKISSDTSVDGQLIKIKEAKEKFNKDNGIRILNKKEKKYKYFTDENYLLPKGWKYVPLSDAVVSIFSGKSPKYSKVENNNLIIGQKVNQEDSLHFEDAKYGTDDFIQKIPDYQFLKNKDILLNTLGGGSVGRVGIFIEEDMKVITDGHIFVIRTNGLTDEKYILYFLRLYREKLEDYANGTTNQKFFNIKQIEDAMIPLPPIEEQERIVKKLEQLLPLCNDIENLVNN